MEPPRVDRRLAAVLEADVVGYSRLIERDEIGTLQRLKALRKEVIEPVLARHEGRIVKLLGDGALVEFPSAAEAVQAAVEVQRAVVDHEQDRPEAERLRFRIGISLGDLVHEDGDIFGEGVNLAARLEQLAEPGGICIARNVYEQARNRLPVAFAPMGRQRLKHLADPVEVFAVHPVGTPGRRGALLRRRFRFAVPVLVLALVLGVAAWFLWPAPAPPVASDMVPDRPSIAVLAFDNFSGDPEQGYLADGLTEDLITELSRNPNLAVLARQTTFSLKDKALTAEEAAVELGVRYVLEGSVQRRGERLRISAQLVDGRTGENLWAERFDPSAADIYEVQDRIVEAIAGRLLAGVWEREKADALRRPPRDLDVYELAVRGLARKHRFKKEDYLIGREELQRAINLDPGYAPAHLYLGYLDAVDIQLQITGAKSLDDLDEAIASIRRGIDLDPNLPIAYQALGLALTAAGRIDEALAAARHSVALGPGDPENLILLSRAEGASGNFDRAIELAEEAISLNPLGPVHYDYIRGRAYYGKGDYERAAAGFRSCLSKRATNNACRVFLAAALAAGGDTEAAGSQIATLLKNASTYNLAVVSALGFPGAPAVNERLVAQLRAAGMPEGPAATN